MSLEHYPTVAEFGREFTQRANPIFLHCVRLRSKHACGFARMWCDYAPGVERSRSRLNPVKRRSVDEHGHGKALPLFVGKFFPFRTKFARSQSRADYNRACVLRQRF